MEYNLFHQVISVVDDTAACCWGWLDGYLMFYAQSTVKGHIRMICCWGRLWLNRWQRERCYRTGLDDCGEDSEANGNELCCATRVLSVSEVVMCMLGGALTLK